MQSWRLTSFLFKAAPHIRQISCCSSSLVAKGFIARRSVIMSTESGIGVAPADEKSTPLGPDGKPLSKNALKKLDKEKEKEKKKAEREAKQAAEAGTKDAEDYAKDRYAILPMAQSQEKTSRVWTKVKDLTVECVGKRVLVRARLHTTRGTGKQCFMIFRDRQYTVQGICAVNDTVSKGMVKFASGINRESILDVEGEVKLAAQKVQSCSQEEVEIFVDKVFVVSLAEPRLPLQIEDASRPETDEEQAHVNQDTRLDNRIIDLRTVPNQAIFSVQAGVCNLFREFLTSQGFAEIHTPKIISGLKENFSSKECCAQKGALLEKKNRNGCLVC